MLWRRRKRDGFIWEKHVKTVVLERQAKRAARAEALADAGARQAKRAQAAAREGAMAAAAGMQRAGDAIAAGAGKVANAAIEKAPRAVAPLKAAVHEAARRVPKPDLRQAAKHAKDPMSLMRIGSYAVLAVGAFAAIAALTSGTPSTRTAAVEPRPEQTKARADAKTVSSGQGVSGSFFSLFSTTQTVSGRATAVSGDTLRIADSIIRLDGIDAPELTQRCQNRRGRNWRCGASAERALTRIVRRQTVTCEVSGAVTGVRTGQCTVGGQDVSIPLLERGRVFATETATSSQSAAEQAAKQSRRGVWSGEAESPSDYRDRVWARAAANAPDGCPIKAVKRRGGRIYMTPWTPGYTGRRVRTGRGEAWFCTEAEAIAAGWQPA